MEEKDRNNRQLINFLCSSQLISTARAADIATQFEYVSYQKGDSFLTNGKIAHDYLFMEKGLMRGFALDIEGNEVTTAFYSSNNVVFEVSSFFTRKRSEESIQALTECTGWVTTFEKLNYLFHSMPEFREFGRMILVKGFASLKERMLSMITKTGEQRYEELLQTNPDIFMHAPLKNIASYLGVTDTSLSRIRRELSKK